MSSKRKPLPTKKTDEFMSANASSSTDNPAKRQRSENYTSNSTQTFNRNENDYEMIDDNKDDEEIEDFEEHANVEGVEDMEEDEYEEEEKDSSYATLKQYLVTPMKPEWARPELQKDAGVLKAAEPLIFQQMDASYYIGEQKEGYPGPEKGGVPIIQLFGVTREGHSVLAHVRGFVPYFYIEMPDKMNKDDLGWFKDFLAQQLAKDHKVKKKDPYMAYVHDVVHIKTRSLMSYHFNQDRDFLVIYVGMPAFVKPLRSILEKGVHIPRINVFKRFLTYESNILFVLRCMIDKEIVGANWIELPAHKYVVREHTQKASHCQIEVDVSHEELISHQPDESDEWAKIAPLRIMSFDIECAGKRGHFPDANHDPVIQIANYVTLQGQNEPFIKNVFVLNTCANIVGADVHSCETEREMLEKWRNFVISVDPDILTGYNIINFDLPYLLNRAKALKVTKFPYLGRVIDKISNMKSSTFSSKAYGTRESKDINIDGRIQLDVLVCIQRDHKLSSYTLNNVSAHFLGEQKEEVHHSIISDLQNGDDESRRRLAVYCLKDAYLPQRLLEKLLIIVNYVEMARVTGIPLAFILQRGQQIKVISQLLRKARQSGFLMPTPPPTEKKASDESYEGATVIPPKTGYYDEPIATLDFASLYPSIMIAHNLCYSTLIKKDQIGRLSPDDYIKTPSGDYFIKASKYEGMLPRILKDLLAARDRAKKDMKNAKDPFMYSVFNGRQLALKVSANSVYGFTGATVGHLPCLEISASVTAFGREMIMEAAKTVETEYTIKNGKRHDATVIYGDTDSVMVRFGTNDLSEAMALGKEAAALVSKKFINPIRLEFEKVYFPYLLLAKKRYAGLLWTRPDKHDKLDAKGIEMVRRDNCPLVRNVVSTCLHMILIERSVKKAEDYAKSVISDLLMNRIDISMLVISKSLSKKSDAYTAKQAHVELAARMARRDPATAPRIGDRVPYVIIKAQKGAKAYEKSEDPIYVLEKNIPIDTEYYVQHKLKNPLLGIFGPIISKPESLFTGDHTRSIAIPTPKTGGIMNFAVVQRTCLKCKTTLKKDQSALCDQCKPDEANVYQSLLDKHSHYEKIYSRVWTHCQRCQGSLHQEVLCTNSDCPIFYMRKKVRKDLHDTQELVNRFQATAITDW